MSISKGSTPELGDPKRRGKIDFGTINEYERRISATGVKLWNERSRGDIPQNAVLCDRTTMWGNPFVLGRDGNRRTVCQKFDVWLRSGNNFGVAEATEERRDKILQHVHILREQDLVCGCWPLECRCLTLAELANKES